MLLNLPIKPLHRLLILLLLLSSLRSQAQQAWVRQTVLDSGLVYDIPLSPDQTTNTFTAGLETGAVGSLFQLFAAGTAWDQKIYLLDSKLIRTYSPAAVIEITSEDPYVRGDANSGTYVRRTRADRPVSLQLQVSGLAPTSSEDAERLVYFACTGVNYDPTTYSGLNQTPYLVFESNLENGTYDMAPLYHELTSATLSEGCGEHAFRVVRYASDGVPATILCEPRLEVWPVSTASFENLETGLLYIDKLPAVIVNLKGLYPDSRTYVQIYAGEAALGTQGTIVRGTERRYGTHYNPELQASPTNVPQDEKLTLTDLSNYAYRDGTYTLEVITETPFFGRAPERLCHLTFRVDRIISTRGNLTSGE